MKLIIFVEDKRVPVNVSDEVLNGATDFYAKMNQDMDKGWQMSRSWIESPNKVQRCQIAADKILAAVHNENQNLMHMMAGYILYTIPEVVEVHIDANGEIMETQLVLDDGSTLSDVI